MEKKDFVQGISEILVKYKIFSEDEAKNLAESFEDAAQETFDEFLLDEGLIEKQDMLKALGEYYQTPTIDLSGYFFQTFLLRKFPKDVMIRNAFAPMEVDQNFMSIVTANPANPKLYDIIGKYVSHDLHFYVSLKQDIFDGIQEFYDKSDAEAGEMLYDDYIDESATFTLPVSEDIED